MSASSAPLPNETHKGTVGRIVGLAVAYDIGVFGLHLFNWFGAPISDTSVARYSGSIAIALCMMALLFIRETTRSRRIRVLALAAATIFAVVSADGIFSIREGPNEDDYLALLLWIIAGSVLFMLLQAERPSRIARTMICAGFFLHSLVAVSDGDVFTLRAIGGSEGILELTYIGLYLAGFTSLLVGPRAGEVPSSTDVSRVGQAELWQLPTNDRHLLELEAWYWAWRSHTEAAETDEDGDRSIDETLSVVARLTSLRPQSVVGLSAKIRVLQDLLETVTPIQRPEMCIEEKLLDAIASDSARLADGDA